MNKRLQILVAGRSRQDLETVAAAITQLPGIAVGTRLNTNGHVDPLYGSTTLPDVLILVLGPNWQEEMGTLAERPPALRPTTVVIGPRDDADVMRMAMRAGARDFLTHPIAADELTQAVQRIVQEKSASFHSSSQSRTIAVINAKGGSGATLIASNLAHMMAKKGEQQVALLDLDFQFGSQALYLDLHPVHDVIEALGAVDDLDAPALAGYMTKHWSGLNLLAAPTDRVVLSREISIEALNRLLDLISQTYDRVVIDLPRVIDPVSATLLERANSVLVVMQQNLASMRDAKRLTTILKTDLEVPAERISIIVNRYTAKHSIGTDDIQKTLQHKTLALIPNDYARVAEATDAGTPLLESARNAPITRALVKLAVQLGGETMAPSKQGVLNRAFSLFSRNP